MSPWVSPTQALSATPGCGWGTVVHVGAGSVQPPVCADALVLVDGDPVACAHLRAATRGRADVEVIERIVGAVPGSAIWHSHSWPAADGLADLTRALCHTYPRIACIQRRTVEADTLSDLVAGIDLDRAMGRPNLLLLDLPSAADAMVAGLSAEQALRFSWIVAGGLPGPVPAGAHLQRQAGTWAAGPWPWRMWRVDAEAYRAAARLAALQRAEAKLAIVAELLLAERLQ